MKTFDSPTKTTERRSPTSTADRDDGARSLRPPRYGIGMVDQRSDRLPAPLQATMEQAFGADFSDVRIHEDREPGQLGALAFTRGADLHFAPGQYRPNSARGRELIGHELTHVVQQRQGRVRASFQAKGLAINDDPALEVEADTLGARAARGERVSGLVSERGGNKAGGCGAVVQCYIDVNDEGEDWRMSDDARMLIRQDTTDPAYGSHAFFADSALIKSASTVLKSQTSILELTAGSDTLTASNGTTSKLLHKVEPKNTKNKTKGTEPIGGMKWPDDCGAAANSIMQGDKRKTKAIYSDPDTAIKAQAAATKVGVISMLGGSAIASLASAVAAVQSVAASTHETSAVGYGTDTATHRGQTLHTPHLMLEEILKATLDPDPAKAWTKYQAMTPAEKDDFDRNVGINKYATPEVGEALSIVSNKDELADGKSAWNFHWGGVCMTSGGDYVTMENFAGSGESAWDFQMYGSAKKEGQTFHEQQAARTHGSAKKAEYGPNPTTIRVRPE